MTEDLDTLKRLAGNWYSAEGKHIRDCPPEARVITGRFMRDGQYYYFEQASGVKLIVQDNPIPETLTGYEIVDEQKYIWFKLRWS